MRTWPPRRGQFWSRGCFHAKNDRVAWLFGRVLSRKRPGERSRIKATSAVAWPMSASPHLRSKLRIAHRPVFTGSEPNRCFPTQHSSRTCIPLPRGVYRPEQTGWHVARALSRCKASCPDAEPSVSIALQPRCSEVLGVHRRK